MRWTDTQQIAEALYDEHPDVNPLKLRFTELHAMVLELDGFDDDPEKSNEAILEAILQAWLDEL
ncbi:Fe-S cluster assembly protein IscX [Parasutterella secunda]|jgi:FeS assembly protein IscX|uniref:Fe-S cluster assembly protein IscX n=1 Tax=Parasutterella secunda TaxID=626947 RepID=UPI000340CC75|nr:Fe-S cluster assembly protein IscX [Parasutterella secunda]CDE74838.1 feS assembly protein IscX [Sutterella sp. CAG:521]HIR21938.1 Fe-S cluster assembly protein IscX [Candidatus Aphodousia faecalis]MCL1596551.1 Fe-S cluster assembly protein IscX [Parasutterella secunda]MCR8920614.1 Fe-S cluster assembly protein IscX [Parasutterella secunda]MDM8088108.1 Fe-S cluster assembly protein IscX [Parasutterella secunda]